MSERDSSPEADNNGLAGVVEETGMAGFLGHLVELRNRLLKSVLVVLVLFLALFPFRNELFTALADPLSKHMPAGTTMIAVQVASPFFIPLKLTALTAVFIAIPFLLYQLWAFIAPGLYKHERKLIAPLVFSSTILFYLGAAFAYFVVFPVVFGFLSTAGPSDVNFAPDVNTFTIVGPTAVNTAITITVTDLSGRCPSDYMTANPINAQGDGWNAGVYQKVIAQ